MSSQTQSDAEHQCPQCGTDISEWAPCHICDFYDLDWWSAQLNEEPSRENRIRRAFHAVDEASASLTVIEERVPNLEESDNWDADGIDHVNDALDEVRSMLSDVSGDVAAAYLALDELNEGTTMTDSTTQAGGWVCKGCGNVAEKKPIDVIREYCDCDANYKFTEPVEFEP